MMDFPEVTKQLEDSVYTVKGPTEQLKYLLNGRMEPKAAADLIELQTSYRGIFTDEKMKQILQRGYILKDAFLGAAARGLLDAMTLLKEWGAPNFDGDEDNEHRYDGAFLSAARCGQIQAMKLLMGWGANNFDEALKEAATCDQEEAIKLLYIWGANNFNEAMSAAERRGNYGIMMRLIDLFAPMDKTSWQLLTLGTLIEHPESRDGMRGLGAFIEHHKSMDAFIAHQKCMDELMKRE